MTVYDTIDENLKYKIQLLDDYLLNWRVFLQDNIKKMSDEDLIRICKKNKVIDKERKILLTFIE